MKTIIPLIALACLGHLCASCAKQDEASEPVEETAMETANKTTAQAAAAKPAPKQYPANWGNATNAFRTPSDDIVLPTDEQIAEGTAPSVTSPPAESDSSQPSISVSPPTGPANSETR